MEAPEGFMEMLQRERGAPSYGSPSSPQTTERHPPPTLPWASEHKRNSNTLQHPFDDNVPLTGCYPNGLDLPSDPFQLRVRDPAMRGGLTGDRLQGRCVWGTKTPAVPGSWPRGGPMCLWLRSPTQTLLLRVQLRAL